MNSIERVKIFSGAYELIAELLCNPRDVDVAAVRMAAFPAVKALESVEGEAARLLSRFLAHEPATEEEYIDLFELSPQCALYLGSHAFEEPKTCSGAANCDRNKYMVEVVNLYRHFGLALDSNELPDYLPMMVEFLALTAGSRDDDVRRKLIAEYMLPFLEPMCSQLDKLETPYVHLCRALDAVLRADLGQVEDTSNEAEVVHG